MKKWLSKRTNKELLHLDLSSAKEVQMDLITKWRTRMNLMEVSMGEEVVIAIKRKRFKKRRRSLCKAVGTTSLLKRILKA